MSDVSKNFSQEELETLRNDIVLNTDKKQIEDANTIAQLLSEDSDNNEELYLSILSYYGNKSNKKELDSLMLKLTGSND
jgi:hypothetical protein